MSHRRLWRTTFAALEIVLLLSIPALAWVGFRAVLDTTEGRVIDPQLDPDEPGYEAQLIPTSVQLVAGLDGEGALSWLTVLVLSGAGDRGGAVLFVPARSLVELDELGDTTLRDAWTTEDGPEVVAQAVADILGAGVGEAEVLDPARIEELFAPVLPLAVDNSDDLEEFESGELELAGDEVGRFLDARDPEESDLARLARQELVWRAWFGAIASSSDPNVVPGETTAGLGRFVRGIAAGTQTFDVIPGVPYVPPPPEDAETPTVEESELFVPDLEATAELVNSRIPLPVASHPGARARVRVLDGVGADGLALAATRDVARAGGQVVVVGNTDAFGEASSRVVYFDEAQEEAADAIAEALGDIAVDHQDGPNPNDLVDITVVVGNDLAEAYGLSPRG